jgi:GTP-binding protein
VRGELEAYAGTLAEKVEIVALNKIDAVSAEDLRKQRDRLKRAAKKTPLLLSGITGKGVGEALRALAAVIVEAPVSDKAKGAEGPAAPAVATPIAQAKPWSP